MSYVYVAGIGLSFAGGTMIVAQPATAIALWVAGMALMFSNSRP